MSFTDKFFKETKRELRAILTILVLCLVSMLVIWMMYGRKLDKVEKQIDNIHNTAN